MGAASPQSSQWPSPRLVYHRRYNIGLFGLERLHPFDSRKYGRAWSVLRKQFGRQLNQFWIKPSRQINRDELLTVHSSQYLSQLKDPKFVAGLVEVPQLKRLPGWAVDQLLLKPMRWATMGTSIATKLALEHGLAMNLSGGYHHASPDFGHGFSAYADVAISIRAMRTNDLLRENDKIVYIDLDAHQGNGVCRSLANDRQAFIYDQYNRSIFPHDLTAQRRIDCDVPLSFGCCNADYLRAVRSQLPQFLDSLSHREGLRLAIYNAGTDVYSRDKLGGLSVSIEGVAERDQFVLNQLISRKIPTIVVCSGGYSDESFEMIAETAKYILKTWGGLQ